MPGISLDFGLLIAYFVPGIITLLGLASIFKDVSGLMSQYRSGKATAGFLLIVSSLAVVIGMAVSVLRASTIDKSFEWNLSEWSLPRGQEHYRSLQPADPDYAQLSEPGKLDAFREVEENDKRPYQFYGNTLLAVIILIAGWWSSSFQNRNRLRKRSVLALTSLIFASVLLYPACRKSYYRYNRAVAAINTPKVVDTNTHKKE
jgi:hypothetical protein